MNGIRTRKSKNIRVSIWPDLGAEPVTCVYSHSKIGGSNSVLLVKRTQTTIQDSIGAKRWVHCLFQVTL